MRVLDYNGFLIYDREMKKLIKKNAYFIGTEEEYNLAYSEGLIDEGMLIILTDDEDA